MKRLLFYTFIILTFTCCSNDKKEQERAFEQALDKGNTYWAQNKYKDAQTYYTQALKLRPNDNYIKKRLVAIDSILKKEPQKKNTAPKKKLPPKEYAFEDSFYEGFARVSNGKKWGYVDSDKQEIVELKYDEAAHFKNGYARVKIKDKYGFIDTTGKEIVKPDEYEQAGRFSPEGLAFVVKENKFGYVDSTGKEIIELKYDWGGTFSDERAKVSVGSKFGFIDPEGEEVIGLEYDGARNFKNELAGVWKNQKWGFVDVKGKEVIPFKYDRVEDFRTKKYKDKFGNKKEEVLAKVVLDGKTFFINKKDECVIDCE